MRRVQTLVNKGPVIVDIDEKSRKFPQIFQLAYLHFKVFKIILTIYSLDRINLLFR